MPAPQWECGVAPVDSARAQLGQVYRHSHEQQVGHDRQDERGEHDVDESHAGGDLVGGVGNADEDVHDHREGEGEEHGDGLAQQQDELLTGPHRHHPPPGSQGLGLAGLGSPSPGGAGQQGAGDGRRRDGVGLRVRMARPPGLL